MNHMIPTALFGVTLLMTGCQTSHIAVGPTRPPVSPEDVKVYFSTPHFPFENVAIINTDSSLSLTFGEQSKVNKVIERLKREAATLGANGIILQGLGAKYMFSVQSGNFQGTATQYGNQTQIQGQTSSTSVPIMEKQGQALAIYVSPQQRDQTGNDDSKPILGLSLREVESMVGKGERIAAETMGLKIAKGDEEPIVFLRSHDDWDRTLAFVFFSDKLEAVMVVLDEPPMTQDAIVRLLDLFAERNTWTREDPTRPEFPLHWKRSDGKYFATASAEKGAFVVGNPSFVSLK